MNVGQDVNGDIDVVDGQLVLVGEQYATQLREIEEHLEQRLRTVQGEWFLERTIGLPYFDEIFTKPSNIQLIEALFIQEILDTPGVIRLLEFNMDLNKQTRTLFFPQLKIQATSGVIDFAGFEVI